MIKSVKKKMIMAIKSGLPKKKIMVIKSGKNLSMVIKSYRGELTDKKKKKNYQEQRGYGYIMP